MKSIFTSSSSGRGSARSDAAGRLGAVFEAFQEAGVPYGILREFSLDEEGDDVDVVAFRQDVPKIDQIMQRFDALKVETSSYWPHLQYHVPFFVGERVHFLVLDLVLDFVFGREFLAVGFGVDRGHFFQTCIEDGRGWKWASPEYRYVFLCFHLRLWGQGSARRRAELKDLEGKIDEGVLERNLGDLDIVLDGKRPEKVLDGITRSLAGSRVGRLLRRGVCRFLAAVSWFHWRIWRRHTLTVAVVGVDGSGKSTVVEAVQRELGGQKRVRVAYMGDQSGGRLGKPIMKLFRRVRWFVEILKLLSMCWYLAVRSLSLVAHKLRPGVDVVLFDRHPFDRLLPSPASDAYSGLRLMVLRCLAAVGLGPALTFHLQGDADVMASRKMEYSGAATRRAGALMKSALAGAKVRSVDIDTTSVGEDVVVRRILLRLALHHRRRMLRV